MYWDIDAKIGQNNLILKSKSEGNIEIKDSRFIVRDGGMAFGSAIEGAI